MNDLTLVSINWNQRRVMELMLKSYVKHHYNGEPLRLMLVDNGSSDDSKQWLTENGVPFIDSPINLGHEGALNMIFKKITTKWMLLCDTDVEFVDNLPEYLYSNLEENQIIAGDLITGDQLNISIKPRIGAWMMFMDIQKIRAMGINKFRDTTDWSYDVGSWLTEQIFKAGYSHFQIDRKPGDIDRDVIGMDYGFYRHLGKMSWELTHHHDRHDEVMMRRTYVEEQLKLYQDIDLKGKFV